MNKTNLVGLIISIIIFLALITLLALLVESTGVPISAPQISLSIFFSIIGLLVVYAASIAFASEAKSGEVTGPDVLKIFGVYETLGSVKINENQSVVIIKAQDEDIRACRMMSVPPKVFKVVKDKEEGGCIYQEYPSPQNFSVSTGERDL